MKLDKRGQPEERPALSRLGLARQVLLSEGIFALDRLRIKYQGNQRDIPTSLRPGTNDWLANLHRLLGAPSSCGDCASFQRELLPAMMAALADRTPASGHRHDGGRHLALAMWAVTVHRKPDVVVETGVGRGVTSASILSAMEVVGSGHLYSVDLPPLARGWAEQSGIAVTPRLRGRWTYIRGSTRRKLPPLIKRLGPVDVFLHDSLHTFENMAFEFGLAWPSLRAGGVLVSDDIQGNRAFEDLVTGPRVADESGRSWFVASEADKAADLWGLVVKPPPNRRV